MYFLIVFRNRFNILIPSIFLFKLSMSLSPGIQKRISKPISESLSSTLLNWHLTSTTARGSSLRLLPLTKGSAQEWDGIGELAGLLNLFVHFVLVGNIPVEDKGGCVNGGLESTLG